MAVDAFVRCVLINYDRLIANQFGLNVTLRARHIRMSARQREMRACVVIEARRNPMLGGVAVAAMGLGILRRELPVVRVTVACLALLGSTFESRCVFRRGFVTFCAEHCAVRTQ